MEDMEKIIKGKKITLYSKDKCASCERAIKTMTENKIDFEIIKLEQHEELVLEKAKIIRNAQMPFCEIDNTLYNTQNTMKIIEKKKKRESVEKNE